jgi:hypothetical protein
MADSNSPYTFIYIADDLNEGKGWINIFFRTSRVYTSVRMSEAVAKQLGEMSCAAKNKRFQETGEVWKGVQARGSK